MHFLASIYCICSRFRSRDLHHVLVKVQMCASFSEVFSACVDFHSLKPLALASGLWSSMLATLFVISCICHYFHIPVAIVKCISFMVSLLFVWALPTKSLNHTPKMLYGEVLKNIAWGFIPKICKTLHWKTPYLSTSGAALCQ